MLSTHSAAATCLRPRSARGICEYATSRTRRCQNEYSACSETDDVRAERTSSLRASSCRPCADEVLVAIAHRGDCARPEDLAHDGSVVQQRLAVRRERVEASRDQRLDVVWYGNVPVAQLALFREHASVAQHPDELLGVQRIALRLARGAFVASPRGGPPSAEARRVGARSRRPRAERARSCSSSACRRPNPGAARTTRAGRCRARAAGHRSTSRRDARRKRRRASSAQWRSSKTSTSGRSLAIPSMKRRHAVNDSSRSPAAAARGADEGREARIEPVTFRRILGSLLQRPPPTSQRLPPACPTREFPPAPSPSRRAPSR